MKKPVKLLIHKTLVSLLLLFVWAAPVFAERSWVQVHYDTGVPAQTKASVESALDVIADMLTEYKLPLRKKTTVIVSADSDSYIKALMLYGYSLEKATLAAKHTSGISLGDRPIILLKGSPSLHAKRDEVFRVLPHEMFHQVQNQFGKQTTAVWMVEAAPELFQILVRERAGLGTLKSELNKTALRVFTAKSIPSAQQLMTPKYADFSALSRQRFPVYQMSLLMLYELTKDHKFEPVLQYYRLLNDGLKPESAFAALFGKPQFVFAAEMDQLFSELRKNRPK